MNCAKLEEMQHKILQIVNIFKFISNRGEVLSTDIKNSFDISPSTLYRNIDEWNDEGHVFKDAVNGQSRNGAHFVVCSTPKLDAFLDKYCAMLQDFLDDMNKEETTVKNSKISKKENMGMT